MYAHAGPCVNTACRAVHLALLPRQQTSVVHSLCIRTHISAHAHAFTPMQVTAPNVCRAVHLALLSGQQTSIGHSLCIRTHISAHAHACTPMQVPAPNVCRAVHLALLSRQQTSAPALPPPLIPALSKGGAWAMSMAAQPHDGQSLLPQVCF
jgi:hypothetical protein